MKKIIEKLFGSKQCVIISEAKNLKLAPSLALPHRRGNITISPLPLGGATHVVLPNNIGQVSPLPLGEGRILNELASCKNSGEGGTKELCHAELVSASHGIGAILRASLRRSRRRLKQSIIYRLNNLKKPLSLTLSLGEGTKCAFTLAEVLLTLGIIGVVAALTLPSLIQNYQKQVWVNQLKKSVSTIEQGFKQALSEDEVFDLQDTELFLSLQGNEYQYPDNDGYNDFNNKLKKYFKVIKFDSERSGNEWQTDYKYLNSNEEINEDDANVLYLSDGTELFMYLTPEHWYLDRKNCEIIKSLGGRMCDHMGYIYIDINGDKSPNTLGKDLFTFYLAPNGNLYPYGGIDSAIMERQQEINSNSGYWRNYEGGICGSKQYDGWACAARIIENGWKMNY